MKTTLKLWSTSGPTAYDSSANYIGANLRGMYTVLSRNRDSDALEESNFEAALERLGGEDTCEDDGTYTSSGVFVASFNHWACGWYETILIDPAAPEAEKAIREAERILSDLENYPVLDEDDWSAREVAEFSAALESGCFDDDLEELVSELVGRSFRICDLREANQARIRACASMEGSESIDRYSTRDALREALKLAR
mgnify:CR=1 FL=1